MEITPYNDTFNFYWLVTSFLPCFVNLYIHISNLYFVMHNESLLLGWKSLLPKICNFQIFNPTFKYVTLCIILKTLIHVPFGDKHFNATWLFVKNNTSYLDAFFLSIPKYWPVYITDATLNINNNVAICLIPLKVHV